MPANPSFFIGTAQRNDRITEHEQRNAQAAASDPASILLVDFVSGFCPHQLAEIQNAYKRRVDLVSPKWFHVVDSHAIGNLHDDQPCVQHQCLYDHSHHASGASIGANDCPNQADSVADYDREERFAEWLDEAFAIDGSEDHSGQSDQAEQADRERVVVVRRSRQQEGKGGPVRRHSKEGAEREKCGLHQDGVFGVQRDN